MSWSRGCNDDFSVNWAAQNGPNGRLSGLIKINDLEKCIMPQIDCQIMWYIILKLYVQISFDMWCSLFKVDSLPSSNKKLSSQSRGHDQKIIPMSIALLLM